MSRSSTLLFFGEHPSLRIPFRAQHYPTPSIYLDARVLPACACGMFLDVISATFGLNPRISFYTCVEQDGRNYSNSHCLYVGSSHLRSRIPSYQHFFLLSLTSTCPTSIRLLLHSSPARASRASSSISVCSQSEPVVLLELKRARLHFLPHLLHDTTLFSCSVARVHSPPPPQLNSLHSCSRISRSWTLGLSHACTSRKETECS
jgi:hypothetical protein